MMAFVGIWETYFRYLDKYLKLQEVGIWETYCRYLAKTFEMQKGRSGRESNPGLPRARGTPYQLSQRPNLLCTSKLGLCSMCTLECTRLGTGAAKYPKQCCEGLCAG